MHPNLLEKKKPNFLLCIHEAHALSNVAVQRQAVAMWEFVCVTVPPSDQLVCSGTVSYTDLIPRHRKGDGSHAASDLRSRPASVALFTCQTIRLLSSVVSARL